MNKNLGKMSKKEKDAISNARLDENLALIGASSLEIVINEHGIPERYIKPYVKMLAGKSTTTERAKLKCLDCVCYQPIEITECSIKRCALWQIRPYQKKGQS